ncbi:MAG: nucleoside deaminase [Bacteroidia bacterium]|nr:nucleoside deaminase [Bacteroidia bacterium]MCZ2141131.1 nucleoside deaminase [Bacteroidia bacterium]
MESLYTDTYFMQMAYKEAQKAFEFGEIPVGAVVVSNNKVIGKGYNLTEQLNDVTAHAEMQAITAATNYLGAKYLTDCTLYVTLEPCVMCGGALYWSKISKVVFGTKDEKQGAGRLGNLYHPKTEIVSGIMESECKQLLQVFFDRLRK